MRRILITGITGFLGKNLVEYFYSMGQIKIYGHSRDAGKARSYFQKSKPEILPEISGNVIDENKIEMIIHLAGIAHDLSGNYKEDDYNKVNFENTKTLYDQFLSSSARAFVFVSSIKAVIDHVDEIIDENYHPNPATPYGKSKLLAEEYIRQHHPSDKKVYILRPCMVHGPGNKGNLNLLYKFVKKRIPYPLGAFENKRSFLSVDNFCFVVGSIAGGNLVPGTYHLADDTPLSTNELVKLIGETIEKDAVIFKVPKFLIHFLVAVGSRTGTAFNKANITKLTESMVVSNKKLLLNLGGQLPVSARQGFVKTIRAFDG